MGLRLPSILKTAMVKKCQGCTSFPPAPVLRSLSFLLPLGRSPKISFQRPLGSHFGIGFLEIGDASVRNSTEHFLFLRKFRDGLSFFAPRRRELVGMEGVNEK